MTGDKDAKMLVACPPPEQFYYISNSGYELQHDVYVKSSKSIPIKCYRHNTQGNIVTVQMGCVRGVYDNTEVINTCLGF